MRPNHLPMLYTDAAVYERERAVLFEPTWTFAALATELASNNDFVRVPLLGRDVIVHNFQGELRAFLNVCSHRHSVLHDAPRGNRPLTCPYHGWSYDRQGVPVGIPARREFAQVLADPQAFRLPSLELAQAGHFVFVRMPPEPGHAADARPTLTDFLGEAHGFMASISTAMDRTLDETTGTVEANWKILIENSLEGYHVPHVHGSSLAAIDQLSNDTGDVEDFFPATGHTYMHNAANSRWLKRWEGYRRDVGEWPVSFPWYVHRLVFPMLTVTSFLGYSFHIQRFHPDSVGATTVHSRIVASRFAGQTARGERIIDAIFRENTGFTHQVFGEDKLASERAQAGSRQAVRAGVLASELEARVANFRATYHRAMGSLEFMERKPAGA